MGLLAVNRWGEDACRPMAGAGCRAWRTDYAHRRTLPVSRVCAGCFACYSWRMSAPLAVGLELGPLGHFSALRFSALALHEALLGARWALRDLRWLRHDAELMRLQGDEC